MDALVFEFMGLAMLALYGDRVGRSVGAPAFAGRALPLTISRDGLIGVRSNPDLSESPRSSLANALIKPKCKARNSVQDP